MEDMGSWKIMAIFSADFPHLFTDINEVAAFKFNFSPF